MYVLFDQRELLIGSSVSLSLRPVLTDGRIDILFNQSELLIAPIVSLPLPTSGSNSNMIGLEAFRPTILFAQLQFETYFEMILDLKREIF